MQLKLKKKNEGFTLLEIIIVIIIVGVLASLALPKFFSTVEYSRSTEALGNLNAIRGAMERCSLQQNDNYANCGAPTDWDIADPSAEPGRLFTYAVTDEAVGTFTLTATRNTASSGDGTSRVVIQKTSAEGVTKFGTGLYSQL